MAISRWAGAVASAQRGAGDEGRASWHHDRDDSSYDRLAESLFPLARHVGFGGPVVLVERMRRDLQETRGGTRPPSTRKGLALAQLAPGPLAAQLAIYLGWVRGGLRGATVVGAAFIAAVVRDGAGALRGVSPLRGIDVDAGRVLRHRRGGHRGDRVQCVSAGAEDRRRATGCCGRIVASNAALTAWTEREIVWVIVASGCSC